MVVQVNEKIVSKDDFKIPIITGSFWSARVEEYFDATIDLILLKFDWSV